MNKLHSMQAFYPHRLKPFHPAESLLHEVGACAQSRAAHNSSSFRAFLRPGDTRGRNSNDARQVCVATSSSLHAMQMLSNLPVPWNTDEHDCDSDDRCVLPSSSFLHKIETFEDACITYSHVATIERIFKTSRYYLVILIPAIREHACASCMSC